MVRDSIQPTMVADSLPRGKRQERSQRKKLDYFQRTKQVMNRRMKRDCFLQTTPE